MLLTRVSGVVPTEVGNANVIRGMIEAMLSTLLPCTKRSGPSKSAATSATVGLASPAATLRVGMAESARHRAPASSSTRNSVPLLPGASKANGCRLVVVPVATAWPVQLAVVNTDTSASFSD